MEGKYLPIGTVCLLKGGTKRVMIVGFGIRPDDNPDIMYDYLGCLFPEGIISLKQNMVFNHDQIQTIVAKGFADDETAAFNSKLISEVAKLNVKQAPSVIPQTENVAPEQGTQPAQEQPQAQPVETLIQAVQPAPISEQVLSQTAQTASVAESGVTIPTLEFEDV